ncbi:MAG: glycosyl hydrolase [Verrucomicrobiales bacterium]|nr:glycosyl hydrolase [Verrucomicrobiales bacterium]
MNRIPMPSASGLPGPRFLRRTALRWLLAPAFAKPGLSLAQGPDKAGKPADTPAQTSSTPSPASGSPELDMRLRLRLENGIDLLDRLYWCPDLNIWLDQSGDQLRAFYEGRRNPPWWSCANAVEMLIDFMNITGGTSHDAALAALHATHRTNADHMPAVVAGLKKRGQWSEKDDARLHAKPRARRSTREGYSEFCNEYLDDSGWWGIAWMKMHLRTQAPPYLATAKAIHRHMADHRLPEPDGGVIWNLEHKPPVANAVSNLLFLNLSVQLYGATGEKSYLESARQAQSWVRKHRLYDGTGIVDAPGHSGDHWTYNQGLWAGGLAALSEATGEAALLEECAAFLNGLLDRGDALTTDGVIREKLSTKGWDTALFKGVFASRLGQVLQCVARRKSQPELADRLRNVLRASADSMLKNSTGPDGQFAMQWEAGARDQEYNYNTHLSGLMLLTAQVR